MFELCLELLVSGTLSVHGVGLYMDPNTNVTYNYGDQKVQQIVVPDEYNIISLCEKKQYFQSEVPEKTKIAMIEAI